MYDVRLMYGLNILLMNEERKAGRVLSFNTICFGQIPPQILLVLMVTNECIQAR